MRLLDPRNGEASDLPPPVGPRRIYVVASVPRSGSTLLCRLLWDTGGAGAPKEYLNPMQIRDWEVRLGDSLRTRIFHALLYGRVAGLLVRGRGWTRERLVAYLERVRLRRSDASGRFGIKIHYHHLESWFLARGWSVEEMLGAERWVYIRRRDRVAQAVSWARALQTGRFAAHQWSRFPSFYSERQIARCVAEIERQEAGWDAFFAGRGIEPLLVEYEELIADMPGTVRRVLGFLGVPDAVHAIVPPPDLRPQADARSARWIERYRASRAAAAS